MTGSDGRDLGADLSPSLTLQQPVAQLIELAWALRQRNFPRQIAFAAPGAKRYDIAHFRNHPRSFVNVSVTGMSCALRCEHCQGRLLETMAPATTPRDLLRLGKALWAKGGQGLLVSGGADLAGVVPLRSFAPALGELKKIGLKVIVHCGLIDRVTALALKDASVDQVLIDVIGDAETCREIYHLDRQPEDFRESLAILKEAGLTIAPHVVIGLHRGTVRGEYEALRHVAEVGVDHLVLVVLSPLARTPLARVSPPMPEEVARIMAVARLQNPITPISLGCARPADPIKGAIERLAIDAGVNAIAYPTEPTVDYASERGLEARFHELCCTLSE